MLSLTQISQIYQNRLPQLIEKHDPESMKLVANVMMCYSDISTKYNIISAISDLPVMQTMLTVLLVDHSIIVKKYFQQNAMLLNMIESAMVNSSIEI